MTAPAPAPAAPSSAASAVDVATLLGDDRPAAWWQRRSLWAGLALLVLLAAGLWWWLGASAARKAPVYVTTPLERGDITLTVTANGTLNPTRSVEVGSELSGTVARVLVDVNDQVKKGQVLVELDRAKFQDTVNSARASLKAAQATLAQSEATVREVRATLARYEEVSRLSNGRVPSATELDGARATLARALAEADNAGELVAKAKATLSTEETNLTKASIRSPIDGVVLTRSVDPGNAVAASLQAVTLFTLGEDLRRLKLEASVDEADVGSVQQGQSASFTVSAYPARRYPATVERVSYGSTTTNNVVTYTTNLSVDNADLSLRPGMTATATIVAVEHKSVLLVPNTALRFTPTSAQAQTATTSAESGRSLVSRMMPRPPRSEPRRRTEGEAGAATGSSGQRQIWVLQGQEPVAVAVQTGISDGRQTEVSGPDLKEGMAVITDQRAAQGGA
ncbi:MAG TPA: efflux RND transporter periplasmic adaptor subunit [Rubrivivax sp.]|nr:efflux RND transporter periplasmic adaptor subunit [Burkholderiales bacterium]HNT38032.1 efflux RND transporter periplasmic adaptor subunit [Rubrivivax sp.]